ncbi:hypothetical protein N0V88_005462 [Collariella sp. IMI 366227]|nr:hypothetical protein N0V88_005462 [Collariella sp. IMI 366227]
MAENATTPIAVMDPLGGKPVCGSDKEIGEYDLGLHVAALFLVMAASIFGAGFPVVAKKVKWVKVPARTFFICKHFGTGVLVATAFVHYPAMPGVIMMGAMFCLFVVEMWLNSKTGGHSHGGPMGFETHSPQHHHHTAHAAPANNRGPPPTRPPRYSTASEFEIDEDIEYEKKMAQKMYDEKVRIFGPHHHNHRHTIHTRPNNPYADPHELVVQSEMPPWFVVFYEQYVRQRLEMLNTIKSMRSQQHQHTIEGTDKHHSIITTTQTGGVVDSPYIDVETGQAVHPDVFRKMSLNITLLEGGILFHSVFVGMTVSITIEGFVILLVAILFHQMFEGLGLGSRIAAVPYPKGSARPWVLVVAFGMTAPLGQAIGLAVKDSYDPNSAFGLIIVGVFNAISSGLLLYAALVDLLAEDFLSEEAQATLTKKDRFLAFGCVILGAAGMSIVGAFA